MKSKFPDYLAKAFDLIFNGRQQVADSADPDLWLFTDRTTGSTIAIRADHPDPGRALRTKLERSRAAFRKQRLMARADRGDLAAIKEIWALEEMEAHI